MSTKALAVKQRIVAILEADATLKAEKFQVSNGYPNGGPRSKWVFVGKIDWQRTEWATQRARLEFYTVKIGFRVVLPFRNAAESEEYVRSMAAGLEEALAADPGFGGLCISSSFQPQSLGSAPEDKSWNAYFDCEVSCQSRP